MRIILGLEKEEGRESNFQMALKSARLHTGRNVDTGVASSMAEMECYLRMKNEVQENQLCNSELFTGLTMYLILLEQIGSIFKRTDILKEENNNGIINALNMFSSLSKKEKEAINGLRNNLAHNFGLASDSRFSKSGRKFILYFSNDAPIVKLPIRKWNCQYDDKEDDSSTVIGVYALCNEIENIIKELMNTYKSGNLKFKLSDEEIKSRFTIIV